MMSKIKVILFVFCFSLNYFNIEAQNKSDDKIYTINFTYTQLSGVKTTASQKGFAIKSGSELFIYTPMAFLIKIMEIDFYHIGDNGGFLNGMCCNSSNEVKEGCFSESLSRLEIKINDSKNLVNGILVGYDLKNSLLVIYPDKKGFITNWFSLPLTNTEPSKLSSSDKGSYEFICKPGDIGKYDDEIKLKFLSFMRNTKLFEINIAEKEKIGGFGQKYVDGTPLVSKNYPDIIHAYSLSFDNSDNTTGVLLNNTIELSDIAKGFSYTEQHLNEFLAYLKEDYRFKKACKEFFPDRSRKGLIELYRYVLGTSYENAGQFFKSYIKIEYFIENQKFNDIGDEVKNVFVQIEKIKKKTNYIKDYTDLSIYFANPDHVRKAYPMDYNLNKSYHFIDKLLDIIIEYKKGYAIYKKSIGRVDSLYKIGKCKMALDELSTLGESKIHSNMEFNDLKLKAENCINARKDSIQKLIFSLIDSKKFNDAKTEIDKEYLSDKNYKYLCTYWDYKKGCYFFDLDGKSIFSKTIFESIVGREKEVKQMIKNEPVFDGITLKGIVEDSQSKLRKIKSNSQLRPVRSQPDSIKVKAKVEEIVSNLQSAIGHEEGYFVIVSIDPSGKKFTFDIKVDSVKMQVNSKIQIGLYKDESIDRIAELFIKAINKIIEEYKGSFKINGLTFYGSSDAYEFSVDNFIKYKESDFSTLDGFKELPVELKINDSTTNTTIKEIEDSFKDANGQKSDCKNKALACFRSLYFASQIKKDEELNKLPLSFSAEFFSKNIGYEYRRVTMEVYFKKDQTFPVKAVSN